MAVSSGDYVPPPQPVTGPVALGVCIFPGWYRDLGRGDYPYCTHDEDSEWRLIAKVPRPRPLLGFYDDSLPEVNDWQIKWALEHGISFFCFDWYWNAGEHRLLRTLERGFLQARYCNLMRFCIHWCNHGLDWRSPDWHGPDSEKNPSRAPTDQELQTKPVLEMTEYLADHYFKRPNYLTIGGRPVLVVWDTRRLIQANGGPAGFAEVLRQMNGLLRAKGLGEVYLVAVGDDPAVPAAGFSARTDYGYFNVGYDSGYEWRAGHSVPYEEIARYHETMWREITGRRGLPYILSLGASWDNRPRADGDAVVVSGKTPERFAALCREAVKHVDPRTNMALLTSWNEWGEGSFVEPDHQWGFGLLDAVRRTFTGAPERHVDYVPGPARVAGFSILNGKELERARAVETEAYVDPPPAPRTLRWQCDAPLPAGRVLKGWEFTEGSSLGWMPYHVAPLAVHDGILSTRVTQDDPQLIVDNVGVAVEDLACIALRLRLNRGALSVGQAFWSTLADPPMSADKCFTFPLTPDGRWHTYQLSKPPEGKWTGTLKFLRLDLGDLGGTIELSWVRLYGKAVPEAKGSAVRPASSRGPSPPRPPQAEPHSRRIASGPGVASSRLPPREGRSSAPRAVAIRRPPFVARPGQTCGEGSGGRQALSPPKANGRAGTPNYSCSRRWP